jgi:RimJ/RimL family protein N-acetyltransferase
MDNVNLLSGKKIRLTAVDKEDLPTISGWYEDSVFSRMFDALPAVPKSRVELEHWLEERQQGKYDYLFAVRPKDGERLIGYIELDGILWPHQTGWLTIGLGEKETWGKGNGREAMELILNFVFNELNLHRIQLTVFSYNERAIKLYKRLGFQQEGVFREHILRDGKRYDMILFGLLAREWAKASNRSD